MEIPPRRSLIPRYSSSLQRHRRVSQAVQIKNYKSVRPSSFTHYSTQFRHAAHRAQTAARAGQLPLLRVLARHIATLFVTANFALPRRLAAFCLASLGLRENDSNARQKVPQIVTFTIKNSRPAPLHLAPCPLFSACSLFSFCRRAWVWWPAKNGAQMR